MLPGFRFLFAAILLSVSMLIFGVGAAALLRATHEQFVANPSWRNGPQEQVFAQATEPAQPVLAAFRAEPVAPETAPSLRDRIPTIGLPANDSEPAGLATSDGGNEPAVQLADTRPTEPSADGPAKAEATVAPPADIAAALPSAAEAAPTVAESQPASTEPATAPSTPVAASAALPADPIVAPAPSDATAKAATLTDPATSTNKAPPAKAKAASAAPDAAAKRRAQQSKKRHRIEHRPPPPPVQQTFDPFAPQQPSLATTATRTR